MAAGTGRPADTGHAVGSGIGCWPRGRLPSLYRVDDMDGDSPVREGEKSHQNNRDRTDSDPYKRGGIGPPPEVLFIGVERSTGPSRSRFRPPRSPDPPSSPSPRLRGVLQASVPPPIYQTLFDK